MAMVTMSRAFGSALGPAIAGYLLDLSNGGSDGAAHRAPSSTKPYLLPLGVMGGISMLAALCLLLLRWRLTGTDIRKRV
jgi:MFS family permease